MRGAVQFPERLDGLFRTGNSYRIEPEQEPGQN